MCLRQNHSYTINTGKPGFATITKKKNAYLRTKPIFRFNFR